MISIEQILDKLGIKSIDDLQPAERETFNQWQTIIAKPDVTIDDLRKILPKELERANHELHNHENSPKKDSYYKAYASVLEYLSKIIVTPAQERDSLRAHLKDKFHLD
jgi:hypothetical protein